MNHISIRTLLAPVLLAAVLLAAPSCIDEEIDCGPSFAEGRPAEVSIAWSTSDMDRRTRAAITEEAEHTVNSLWIAIYDYGTGEIKPLSWTENGTAVSSSEGRFLDPDVMLGDHELATTPVELHTLSGRSRVVAVANVDNYGVSSHAALSDLGPVSLRELLRRCDTWEKYCSVSVLSAAPVAGEGLNTPNISLTDANMPMAGVYYPTLNHDGTGDPVDWTADEVNYVDLPAGASRLPGTIHLRRLHAYVDFHVIPAANITFEPISWQVRNVPYASYCQERSGEGQNAGDGTLLGADYKANYAPSRLSRIFERKTDLGAGKNESGVQFSYYQFENKHTALPKSADADYTGAATYKDREREWTNPAADGKVENTGIYKSLTADPAGDANNMATYVEIQAKVTYYVKGQNADGTGGTITAPTDPDALPRMGFVTYVVHLGYCENRADDEARSRDFNCRRNTRYTYTVRVRGLNDIVVEATSDAVDPAKDTPGAEGDVTDYEGSSIIELDAHYGVFNIQMSNKERADLCWRIKVPYGDELKVLSFADYVETAETADDRKNPFYNWIRFKPTSGETVLATYRASNISADAADAALWTLEDMRDVANHPNTSSGGSTGAADPTNETQRWYTVFIDENAYLLDQNGEAVTDWRNSDWTKYVNRDDRIAWLIVDNQNYKESPDGESIYSKVKYLITQRSIQTYYSTENPNDTHTALGVEHFNETFGKNLTWQWTTGTNDNLSHSNGRWNCWQYLKQSTYSNRNSRWTLGSHTPLWSEVVTSTAPDNGGKGYRVPALRSTTTGGTRVSNRDPDTGRTYYEILAACMSRNRDLDGDGQIDADELRWYLPAEGKYERIMLGRNALRSWLFNPTQDPWYTTGDDPYAQDALDNQTPIRLSNTGSEWQNGKPNWVHYASSDHRKFFTDEGGSFHWNLSIYWENDQEPTGRWPWNIRCVRNLGTSMATVTASPDDDPVERAYTFTPDGEGGGVFDAISYDDNCLRAPIQTYLPVHTIGDLERNLIARKFAVAKKDAVKENIDNSTVESVTKLLNDNIPCRDYHEAADGKDTWRIPNQREAMMILTQGLVSTDTHVSCTLEAYGGQNRFAGTENNVLTMLPLGKLGTLRVRCVRDIE